MRAPQRRVAPAAVAAVLSRGRAVARDDCAATAAGARRCAADL